MLNQLNASINIISGIITTSLAEISVVYENHIDKNDFTNFQYYSIEIPPRTNQAIKLPVTINHGYGILNYTKFGNNTEIPKAIVHIKNNFAITTVVNAGENPVKITFYETFDIEH